MTNWNYRIIKSTNGCYGLHETYYDANDQVRSWTTHPIDVFGETEDELRRTYELMSEAFDMPVLDEVELLKTVSEDDLIDNGYDDDECEDENWDDDPLDDGTQ